MGSAREAATGVTSALEARDLNRARTWLANNFAFHDPTSPRGPMTADEWLASNATLYQAFPDFSYNFEIVREEGNQVWVRTHMEGTHSGAWDLTGMGIGVVPASGRKVSTGGSTTRGVVNGEGKIESIEVVEQAEDGGIVGILQQIGVKLG